MADIRIKDLTTTASSTASDDFIAVDGTTNGTRKLNAFSPTFGGNVVVTGTLTSQSTLSTSAGLSCANATITQGYAILTGYGASADAGNLFLGQSSNGNFLNSSLTKIYTAIGGAEISNNVAAGFRVVTTTASTTTSTGALVVGNGTSGGLGVGGAINAGGDIATAATMRSVGFHVPGNGAGRPASTDSYLASTATTQIPLYVSGYTGGGQSADILRVSLNSSSDWFSVKGNGQVSCFATTASTSTSSGALVVSGGVGVAGAVFTGGYVHPGGDSNFYIRTTGSSNGLIRANFLSADVASAFLVRNDTGTTEYVRVDSAGLIAAIPATAPSLTVNGTMTFERTSNTSLKISVRGTDGTTRSVSLTLA